MRIAFLLLFLSINVWGQENFNLELIGQFPIPEGSNDVWGFTGSNGKDYAVVGTRDATKIIDISNPDTPLLIDSIGGSSTNWRDIKFYNDHLYVTTDGNVDDGILIIDVTTISDSIRYKYINPEVEVLNGQFSVFETIENCHNLYIDEKGYCYLAGCNPGVSGIIILDLHTDPWNPSIVGIEDEFYAHDVYVQGDLMFASEIYNGRMAIYNIADRSNPVFINGAETTSLFTHNVWVSDDGNFAFTTDERPYANVDSYDISDLNDIKRLDVFSPIETKNDSIIPHNTHYLDGFLITSWYTDGVVIIDASKPDNMIKVGSYDTWPGPHGSYRGCWGAYPFGQNGYILASDRTSGLFIFKPQYQRASYLEGTVTSSLDGNPINDVQVIIEAAQLNLKKTNAIGQYKTGLAKSGNYMVSFTHKEYESKTEFVNIKPGEISVLDIELDPLSTHTQDLVSTVIKVFPNPTKGSFLLESKAEIGNISIYSSTGVKVGSYKFLGTNRAEIKTALSPGSYIIQFDDNPMVKSMRLIITE